VYYYQTPNTPIAFGLTQWLDGTAGGFNNVGSGIPMTGQWLVLNIVIAGVFAMFGLLARRGHDVAYVIGMFLYIVDALLVLGLKDFFGFGFHIFALFFDLKSPAQILAGSLTTAINGRLR
jgi:hypothetical protein